MKSESSDWVKAIQNGLVGGGIALLLSLDWSGPGFQATYIIHGLFTMGQVFAFSAIIFESYQSVRKSSSKIHSPFLQSVP
jgi:hypothetical protein